MRSQRREEGSRGYLRIGCMPLSLSTPEVGGCEGGCETPFEKYVPAMFWTYFMVINVHVCPSALILGGVFYMGAVFATVLAK